MDTTVCARCGRPAGRQTCPGDGRKHGHGEIHLPERGVDGFPPGARLAACCDQCLPLVWEAWNPGHRWSEAPMPHLEES